jgi:tape measure domain-containing protein
MAAGFKLLDAYVEVRADASKVIPEAEREIRSGAGRMSSAGGGLGSSLMGGMQGVIGGLVGGVVSAFAVPLVQGVGQAVDAVLTTAKTAIFDYNTTLENANIGFTTMLGSAQKARSFLGELQTFAAKTPFEFSDLTLASQRLIAMGINAKNVIPTMTAIGDAVAGLGGDKGTIDQLTTAIGQMAAKGKVQGDELMQLTEAGVPALKILADGYGVTTSRMSDMISAGQVLSDKAIPMIVRGLEKGTKTTAGFGGMMAKQSKTMSGSLSNISDSINQTLSKAFLPMFKVVERAAGALAKFAGSKGVQKWANDTAKSMSGFLSQVGKAIKEVFADPKVAKSIGTLGKDIANVFKDLGPAFKKALPDLIQFAKDVLPSVIDAIDKVVKKIPTLIAWWGRLAAGLKVIGPTVANVIGFFGDLTGTLFDVSANIGNFVADAIKGFRGFVTDAQTNLGNFESWLGGLVDSFVTIGNNIVSGLGQGIANAWDGVMGTIHNLVNSIPLAVRKLLGIASPSKVFAEIGGWVGKGLQKGLLGSVDDVKAASGKLADAIKSKFSGGTETRMLSELSTVTKKLVSEAKERQKVVDLLDKQKATLADLRSSRNDYLMNVRGSVLDSGNIVNTFGAGKDAMATWKDANATYQQGLAAARAQDAQSRMGAGMGSLDGRAYQGSYSTQGGGSAVADFMANNAAPGKKPLTGIALIKSNLKKLIGDTKKFTANLKILAKRKLYPDIMQQLIAAGPTEGLELSRELVNDKAGFSSVNSLGRELAIAGSDLGEFGAGFTYDGSIKAAKRSIDRLSDARDSITVNMIVEARKIDEVDKVVKMIHAAKHAAKAKNAAKRKAKR